MSSTQSSKFSKNAQGKRQKRTQKPQKPQKDRWDFLLENGCVVNEEDVVYVAENDSDSETKEDTLFLDLEGVCQLVQAVNKMAKEVYSLQKENKEKSLQVADLQKKVNALLDKKISGGKASTGGGVSHRKEQSLSHTNRFGGLEEESEE